MSDKKISQLTAATTPLDGTETLPIVKGGSTVKVPVSDLTAGRSVSMLALSSVGSLGTIATDTNGAVLSFSRAADNYITAGNGAFNYYAAPHTFKNRNGTTTYLTVSDNVTVNTGNLVIGTSGKGIDFSATGDAGGMTSELLADYEEGTWTPTLIGSSTNPTVTYSIQRGVYTKVGRLVTVTAYFAWTAYSGGSGDSRVGGLPYTVESATGAYGGAGISFAQGITYAASRTWLGLEILSGFTSLRFRSNGSAVNSTAVGVAEMASSGTVIFTASYSV